VRTNHVAAGFRYWRLGHDRSFASGARVWQRWPRADLLGVNTPGIVARSLRDAAMTSRAVLTVSVRDRTIKFHAKNILGTGARALLEDVREGIIRKSAPFKSA
jgi:hypothetical protein